LSRDRLVPLVLFACVLGVSVLLAVAGVYAGDEGGGGGHNIILPLLQM